MLTVETYQTIQQAAGALHGRSRYLGGGTLVMRAVNYADQDFDHLVRTRDPNLRAIQIEGARIRIGAGCTMADIIGAADTAFLAPVARAIGGPAIRNMATVGGNLFAPHPYGDLATALLALDGIARLTDGSEQPVEALLATRNQIRGLATSITVVRPMGDDFRFLKVSRVKPKGVSVMSIAVWTPRSGGRISGARVAYGAMGPTPLRAKAAERALEGATRDRSGIAAALAVATDGLSPADDSLASAWYRREVAPVHLRRVLLGEDDTR
ncbi:FAD binding domain-containing protein [Thalassobaculum sp.]|uniref:FAD binding domain-containing protein n=1 Tax=Thalassobaculum sp. TaxID=2022740 RepID=UPI0032EE6BFF